MADWEDDLSEELNTRKSQSEHTALTTHNGEELHDHFNRITTSFQSSVSRVHQGAQTEDATTTQKSTSRHRWRWGERTLSVRLDEQAAKIFLSLDLGRELMIEELTVQGGELKDPSGLTVDIDELGRRFITLLFRGL